MDSDDSRWDDHQPNFQGVDRPWPLADLFETETHQENRIQRHVVGARYWRWAKKSCTSALQRKTTHCRNQGFCGRRVGHTNSNKQSMNNTQSINMNYTCVWFVESINNLSNLFKFVALIITYSICSKHTLLTLHLFPTLWHWENNLVPTAPRTGQASTLAKVKYRKTYVRILYV